MGTCRLSEACFGETVAPRPQLWKGEAGLVGPLSPPGVPAELFGVCRSFCSDGLLSRQAGLSFGLRSQVEAVACGPEGPCSAGAPGREQRSPLGSLKAATQRVSRPVSHLRLRLQMSGVPAGRGWAPHPGRRLGSLCIQGGPLVFSSFPRSLSSLLPGRPGSGESVRTQI